MNSNNESSYLYEFDDGVVCFGPLTESQFERQKRLPRRTVLPSDFKLSQSFVMSKDEDEDDKNKNELEYGSNECSTIILDESKENTISIDDSINVTQPTTNIINENSGAIELKSLRKDSSFSSPCLTKCVPSEKLIDTEVINRYIRMGSVSSNESFSEDQNVSKGEDISYLDGQEAETTQNLNFETVSYVDIPEVELTKNNSVYNETSSSVQLSISSVIEQSICNNQNNFTDVIDNVCTLKHCSQEEKDLSVSCDLELEDVIEDSIITDEYNVTPGKQRLFDLRLAKPSFRAKTLVSSAPFMDRIEETSVVPIVLDSSLNLRRDVNSQSSKNEENIDVSMIVDDEDCNLTDMYLNQTTDESNLESTRLFDETKNQMKSIENSPKSESVQHVVSKIGIKNDRKSIKVDMEVESIDMFKTDENHSTYHDVSMSTIKTHEKELLNEKMSTDSFSVDHSKIDAGNNDIINISDFGLQNFNAEKSHNNLLIINVPTIDSCDDEKSINIDVKVKPTNFIEKQSDGTFSVSNQIDAIENVSGDTELKLAVISRDTSNTQFNLNDTFNINKTGCLVKSITNESLFKSDNYQCVLSDKILNDNEKKSVGVDMEINSTKCVSNNIHIKSNIESCTDDLFNTIVPMTNTDETSRLFEIDVNSLNNSTAVDISYSEKMEYSYSDNNISKPCNKTSDNSAHVMKQYLDFEQNVYEICNDISLANCNNLKCNESNNSDQTQENNLMLDQTLCSETLNSNKVVDSLCNFISPSKSNLLFIENQTLAEISNDSVTQKEELQNYESVDLISENILNENQEDTFSKTTYENKNKSFIFDNAKLSTVNKAEIEIETKFTNILTNNSDLSLFKDKDMTSNVEMNLKKNKLHNTENCLKLNVESSKNELNTLIEIKNPLDVKTIEQVFISEDNKDIFLSHNILYENNVNQDPNQTDLTDQNFSANDLASKTENSHVSHTSHEQNVLLNNSQQHNLLNMTKNINNSLDEFKNMEEMFNLEDNKNVLTSEFKTPKTKKLLDFSIIQQTPTFESQVNKQKLLNFSIVEQTPNPKNLEHTLLNENLVKNNALIDFSLVDQVWNTEISTNDMTFKKDFHDISSNNLSSISVPEIELLVNESHKTNHSSTFNQTITETNLNQSKYSCELNEVKINIDQNTTEKTNIAELSSTDNYSMVLNNEETKADKPLNFTANKTIEYLELPDSTKSYNKQCLIETTTELINCSSNNTEFKIESNKQLILNSKECAIVDNNIIEEPISQAFKLMNNENIKPVNEFFNLNRMSSMPIADTKPNDQIFAISSNSGDNNVTINFEESALLHHVELNNMQLDDVSLLMESSEKSSIDESFHSIELDQVQEDGKRKINFTQNSNSNEKKMKVEELKTPKSSMLYRVKNMFTSTKKSLYYTNNTKENDGKSEKYCQKLNFNKLNENKDDAFKSMNKSKIPCKIFDKSTAKIDEINNSSIALNNSIKPKKTIPKFIGVTPVLSDVSNSSNRKCL